MSLASEFGPDPTIVLREISGSFPLWNGTSDEKALPSPLSLPLSLSLSPSPPSPSLSFPNNGYLAIFMADIDAINEWGNRYRLLCRKGSWREEYLARNCSHYEKEQKYWMRTSPGCPTILTFGRSPMQWDDYAVLQMWSVWRSKHSWPRFWYLPLPLNIWPVICGSLWQSPTAKMSLWSHELVSRWFLLCNRSNNSTPLHCSRNSLLCSGPLFRSAKARKR